MSNPIKKLVGHTAIYGLSSMVGRLLNFLLVPLYTSILPPADYGVVSQLYAWVAFLVVFLTFGMETTYFKFLQNKEDKDKAFNQGFLNLISLNSLFVVALVLFQGTIADILLFPDHPEYILLMGAIVALDAFSAVPLAKLRAEEKAKKFAAIQFTSIATNIILNLFFIFFLFDESKPETGVIYILVANLISSGMKPFFFLKTLSSVEWKFNFPLMKSMVVYAFPLMIAGMAGIVNETVDRIMLKYMLYDGAEAGMDYANSEIGIYSACYKLAIFINLFLQAYRYAAEPLFFSMSKDKDRNKQYRNIMNLFIAVLSTMFLIVSLNIDFFKLFIRNEEFYVGLGVVPILLLANIFLGIYVNQSIWYKLSGQTKFGAYIAIGGATITILFNFMFIPIMGFWASAWATLLVYFVQMVASYLLSRKHYPIPYNLRKFVLYIGFALVLFFIGREIHFDKTWINYTVKNLLIVIFLALVFVLEKNTLKPSTKRVS